MTATVPLRLLTTKQVAELASVCSVTTDGRSLTVSYIAMDAVESDEAEAAIFADSLPNEGALVRTGITNLRRKGAVSWEADVTYAHGIDTGAAKGGAKC